MLLKRSLSILITMSCFSSLLIGANVSAQTPSPKEPIQQTPIQQPEKPPQPKKPKIHYESCNTSRGEMLCHSMRDLRSSFNWTCTGSPCYDVWANQLAQLSHFVDVYDSIASELSHSTRFGRDIGNFAFNVASTICRSTAEGDPGVIVNLVTYENFALPRLQKIQQRANIVPVYMCEKIVR